MTQRDTAYRITSYESQNADAGKEWLARVDHPRTKLTIFFDAPTEAEVITKASNWWEEFRKEREEAWARKEAARAERLAKDAANSPLPTTVNWSSAAEASAALERGELPEGYTVDAEGTLHLPLGVGTQKMRGSSVIMAHFDRIVNVNGDVLKSQEGAQL